MWWAKRIVSVATVALILAGAAVVTSAEPPAGAQPAPPVIPWANKFFLPDIAANREQTAPAAIIHNFGEVPHGTLCVHKFTITNIYDTPMQITDVRKSCSCLDYVPMTKVLQPNQTAEFTVTMNTGKFVGNNTQTFYVTFGPKYISTAVIRVSANSRTDVAISPGAVSFGVVAQGSRASQSVQIKYSGRSRDWRITEVVQGKWPFEVRLSEVSRGGPIRGGAEYQVEVTLNSTAAPGAISEQITLKTNDSSNPLIQIGVTGNIVAPLELTPNKVKLEAKVGETGTQRVLVRAAKPFKVVGVDGVDSGVTVELPAAPAALPVQFITLKFTPTQPGSGSIQLVVRTDLESGGTVVLPVELEAK